MPEVTDKLISTVTAARGIAGTLQNRSARAGAGVDTSVFVNGSLVDIEMQERRGFVPKLEYQWAGITVKVWMDYEHEYLAEPENGWASLDATYGVGKLFAHVEVKRGMAVEYSDSVEIASADVKVTERFAVLNEALGISIRIGGDFERRASWDSFSPAANADLLYMHYPDHYSPHGMPAPRVEYYYRPPDTGMQVDVEITHNTTTIVDYSDTFTYSELGYADIDAWRAAFRTMDTTQRIGLPAFYLDLTATWGADAGADFLNSGTATAFLSGTLLGNDAGYTFNLSDASDSWIADDGAVAYTTTGPVRPPDGYELQDCYATLDGTCGQYTITHTGTVKHLDGTAVTGAIIQANETGTPSDTTDEYGAFGIEHTYGGIWSAEMRNSIYVGPGSNNASILETDSADDKFDTHSAVLTNPLSLEEPYFPVDADMTSDLEWLGFSDTAMQCEEASSAFYWPGAVTFSADASKRVVDWIASHTGWSITGGTADITTDTDGALKISNISGSPVLTADLSAQCWAGARLLEVLYTSDDDDTLTLSAGNGEWSITPDSYTVDVLQPTNHSGYAHTPAVMGGVWPWHYGIDSPGNVEISGFRTGKVYSFKHIDLKRLTAEQGGVITCVIFPQGPFVGDAIQHGRQGDQHVVGSVTGFEEHGGLVIVDGVVAAELTTTTREPSGSVNWAVNGVLLNDSLFMRPSGGLLTITSIADVSAAWLSGGFYNAYNDLQVSARLYANVTRAPATWGGLTLPYNKVLRGCIRIQWADGLEHTVTIKKRWGVDGPVISTSTHTSSNDGVLYLPLQQPTCESVGIGPGTDLAHVTVSGLDQAESKYTGLVIYVRGGLDTHQKRGISSISSGVATLSTQLTEAPSEGSIGYIVQPIVYTIEGDGGFLLRSESTGQLLRSEATGELLRGGGAAGNVSMRNHALEYILIH